MPTNTCLGISQQSIDIAIADNRLALSVSANEDLKFVVADTSQLALSASQSDGVTLRIADPSALNITIQDPSALAFSLSDTIIKIIAQADDPENTRYAKRVDFVGESIIYKGVAVPGTLDTDALWKISKIEFIGVDKDVVITFAGGNELQDKVWNDRLTLNYT